MTKTQRPHNVRYSYELEPPPAVLKIRTTLEQLREFLNPPENGTLILNIIN